MPGPAVQRWSGALRFARGHGYVSAAVTQVDAGPDFLEVVARTTGGTLRRHVWSPGPGSSTTASWPGRSHRARRWFRARPMARCGSPWPGWTAGCGVLQGFPGRDYPALRFEVANSGIAGVVAVDAAWHDDHLDLVTVDRHRLARLSCQGRAGTDLGPGSVLAARLVVEPGGERLLAVLGPDGRATLRRVDEPGDEGTDLGVGDELAVPPVRADGRVECHVMVRRGGRLWHPQTGPASPGAANHASLVEAQVWAEPGTASVHRG